MAYYLKWPNDGGSETANNQLCQLSGIATSGTVTVALEFAENMSPHTIAGRRAYIIDGRRALDTDSTGDSGGYIYSDNIGVTQVFYSNFKLNGASSTVSQIPSCVAGDVFSFDYTAGSGDVNGVVSIGCRFNRIGAWWGLALRKITITDGNGTHIVDMSSSNGTADTFTSLDGIVTLKLFGFTGGQWVFYSTGGGTVSASVAVTMPQLAASVAASKTAPLFAASISATMPQMVAAVSAQSLAPSSGAAISFAMPQMGASAIADNSAPVFASAVSATMPQFTVSASAENTLPGSGAVVSFTMPQMVAAASASKTVPTYSASVAAAMPQFAVSVAGSALVDVKSASISFAMPQFAVSVAGSNVVPIRQASIAFTMPQMRAQILTGGVAFYQDPRAHIELVAASRHLEYTNPSRHIELRRA